MPSIVDAPAATAMTSSSTSSFDAAATLASLISRKTAVAIQPRRSLPSTSAWLSAIDWSSAAAFNQMVG